MFRIPLRVRQKLGVELLVDLSKPGEIKPLRGLLRTAGSEAHPSQYLQTVQIYLDLRVTGVLVTILIISHLLK